MFKKLSGLLLLVLLFSGTILKAQYGIYNKIEDEYLKKEHEKCVNLADKFLSKSKHKDSPYPYLFKSKCLLEVSVDPSLSKDYPKSINNALDNAELALAKGDSQLIARNHKAFFKNLKTIALQKAEKLYEEESYDAAQLLFQSTHDLFKDTLSLYGVGKTQRYTRDSLVAIQTLEKVAKMNYKAFKQKKHEQTLIPQVFIDFSYEILDEAIIDSAFNIITVGTYVFPKDSSIKGAFYNILKNYNNYLLYYDRIYKALKIALFGARVYPEDKRFADLERKTMIKTTNTYTKKGQYGGVAELYEMYIKRHGNAQIADNLYDANLIFIDLINKSHQMGDMARRDNLTKVLAGINIKVLEDINVLKSSSREDQKTEAVIYIAKSLADHALFKDAELFLTIAKASLENDIPIDQELKRIRSESQNYEAKLDSKYEGLGKAGINDVSTLAELVEGYLNLKQYEKVFDLVNRADEKMKTAAKVKALTRRYVIDDYNYSFVGTYLLPDKELKWNGAVNKCKAGTIAETAHKKVEDRVNYFRRLAGVKERVALDAGLNKKCQQAAVIVHANRQELYNPTKAVGCYTDDGAEACGYSNLTFGLPGSNALSNQIESTGNNEDIAESRRWLLNPAAATFGHGSTDSAMALWVIPKVKNEVSAEYKEKFIAWPPEGYAPVKLIPKKWSFSLHEADFSKAIVKMSLGPREIPVQREEPVNGPGLNTLVWRPGNVFLTAQDDLIYTVTIYNVKVAGKSEPVSFTYDVVIVQV